MLRLVLIALGLSVWIAESNQAIADETSDVTVFEQAWNYTRWYSYDKRLYGPEWDAIGDKYRPQASAAKTAAELSIVVNAMLAELKTSHTALFTTGDPEYYWLADAFARWFPNKYGWWTGDNQIHYPTIGIITRKRGDQTFVSGVLAGLPGATSGILVGDEILSVDGAPFSPVMSFSGKTGRKVVMAVRRTAGGASLNVTVVPELLNPQDMFMRAMVQGARVIKVENHRIGYIHVWSYASREYHRMLEDELAEGTLKDADALIWDLREGMGGAEPAYLRTFGEDVPIVTKALRDGEWKRVFTAPFAPKLKWHKPVVMLVNEKTRSAKEVLAYAFRRYHYGEVIGTRTAGAVLVGWVHLLKDRSILYLPQSDLRIDGERLEGRGVDPTIEVPFTLEYSAGRDPQLERAIEELVRELSPSTQNSRRKS